MKSFLKQFAGWVLSCVFGVFGGYLYSRWQTSQTPKTMTVRASRFELTDSSGKVLAFWGTDRANNTVLAFLQTSAGEGGPQELKFPAEQTRFTGQNPDEAFAVGILSTRLPFLNILGKDGKSRALLYLTQQQKPIFNMADEHSESRLELGFISNDAPSPEDDDWALRFRAPDVAGIGSIRDPTDRKHRGYLSVERNPKEK